MVKILKTKYDPKYVPQKGDIIWVNFNPIVRHEQGGKRPAIVVSSKLYNAKSGMAVVCPITSHSKNYPFEVEYVNEKISGFILSDQIRTIDWKERKAVYIVKVDEVTIVSVTDKIKLILGN